MGNRNGSGELELGMENREQKLQRGMGMGT